ncbi:MAG: right-handed parallel beta-helix repeat-containing protein [Chthoniobacterales bacterium]
MNTRQSIIRRRRTGALSCALLFVLSTLNPQLSTCFAQGSLTPPGPPAPTMKKLDEVEPRTNLQATPAPAGVDTSNTNYHFIINQPGSYYLSANLGVTKANGIQINAEGVTLDLNGFQISRTSGTGGNGIEIGNFSHRASIRNGSLKGFASGIRVTTSSGLPYPTGCAFRDLAVSNCTISAISIPSDGAVFESCRVHNNSGSVGIATGESCTLSNCTAVSNTADFGIFTGSGCSLHNCSANFNRGTASTSESAGIRTGQFCSISNCTASFNTSTATATNSTGIGFDLYSSSTIQNCTAYANQGDGIIVRDAGTVIGCTVTGNGNGANGAGINANNDAMVRDTTVQGNHSHGLKLGQRCKIDNVNANGNGNGTTGSGISTDIHAMIRNCSAQDNRKSGIVVLGESIVADCRASHNGLGGAAAGIDSSGGVGACRIEGNQARDNIGTGFLTNSTGGDIVIRNSAGNNSVVNYNPATGANIGLIQAPNSATNPMANITF